MTVESVVALECLCGAKPVIERNTNKTARTVGCGRGSACKGIKPGFGFTDAEAIKDWEHNVNNKVPPLDA